MTRPAACRRTFPTLLALPPVLLPLALCVLSSCKQPFEPDAPAGGKLIVYSILNGQTDTQYVRIVTTYGAPPSPEIRGARVELHGDDGSSTTGLHMTARFRDTTIERMNAQGGFERLQVYAADHLQLREGAQYELQVTTASGLSARATTTTLRAPAFAIANEGSLNQKATQPTVLNASFASLSGAYEMHFYLDYYALVDNGWKLHRTEVAKRSYVDDSGRKVLVYPELIPVTSLAISGQAVPIAFDTTQYRSARARVVEEYGAPYVVWVQAVFVLTQVDDVLYSYHYVNNAPVDQSSIRLDVPEFTNITGGFGVFGSSVTVSRAYSLLEE